VRRRARRAGLGRGARRVVTLRGGRPVARLRGGKRALSLSLPPSLSPSLSLSRWMCAHRHHGESTGGQGLHVAGMVYGMQGAYVMLYHIIWIFLSLSLSLSLNAGCIGGTRAVACSKWARAVACSGHGVPGCGLGISHTRARAL
jgi:hypothetical protein